MTLKYTFYEFPHHPSFFADTENHKRNMGRFKSLQPPTVRKDSKPQNNNYIPCNLKSIDTSNVRLPRKTREWNDAMFSHFDPALNLLFVNTLHELSPLSPRNIFTSLPNKSTN